MFFLFFLYAPPTPHPCTHAPGPLSLAERAGLYIGRRRRRNMTGWHETGSKSEFLINDSSKISIQITNAIRTLSPFISDINSSKKQIVNT